MYRRKRVGSSTGFNLLGRFFGQVWPRRENLAIETLAAARIGLAAGRRCRGLEERVVGDLAQWNKFPGIEGGRGLGRKRHSPGRARSKFSRRACWSTTAIG